MKNNKLVYGILAFISLAGIGIVVFLKLKKKNGTETINNVSQVAATEDIEETKMPVDKIEPVTQQTVDIISSEPSVYELGEPERPDFYDDEMQRKLEGLVNWYSTNGDYSTGYANWIKQWPGEKYRVKSPDDYLYETAIQDLLGKKEIDLIQAVYLRRYYGIGWEILAPKDRNKVKPTWLNTSNWEYHMWWYFNYFYHEQKYGNIKDSFYKALDTMGHDNGISADKIQQAKDYYDTTKVI